ncbi:hypothetical protein D3C84_1135700 [compost metagenome]
MVKAASMRSPMCKAVALLASGRITQNSSPPIRHGKSDVRQLSVIACPRVCRTSSPFAWPKVSLMNLNLLTSM